MTARSISPASRTLTGLTSTPSDGATAWMAANWPIPAAMAGSRRTAARVTPGAISLSSSSHFPLMLYSNCIKPVALPPGRARLSTKPAPTGSATMREHDRHGAGRLQQRPHGRAASGQDDVRRERDQFRRVFANVVGIARGPAGVDPHVAAVGPAQLLQPLQERRDAGLCFRIVRGRVHEHADAPHPLGLLRARGERPRGRRAAEQRDELAPPHVRPHAQETASYRFKRVL